MSDEPGTSGPVGTQMGREVLEGLRVSQCQQRPFYRKINKRIIAHPVIALHLTVE